MKRFYNKRICAHWHKTEIPNSLYMSKYGTPEWVKQWCWEHNSTGRFFVSPYTGVWFELASDAEAFKAQLTWKILQTAC